MLNVNRYLPLGVMTILLLSGCFGGLDEPARRGVKGSVSYDQQPIEYGEIRFLPEPTGPMTIATISKGKYELPAANGVLLGPASVQITSLTRSIGPLLDEDISTASSKVAEIPAKYNSESTLRADISAGSGPITLDFDLEK